jgi:hypothetical protein
LSPTRVLTVEASVANLALTAPLQGIFISWSISYMSSKK